MVSAYWDGFSYARAPPHREDEMSDSSVYLRRGLGKVDGWLNSYSAKYIKALAETQDRLGERGAVGEIGVHHGKLFILLALSTLADEGAFGIDVFGDQHLNADASGKGDKEILLSNIHKWAAGVKGVEIIQKLSFDVTASELLEKCGRARLVSVDGGHTEECVINDLSLIEAVLTDRGVVILDDYFNEYWPEVSTGAQRYLLSGNSKLRPFAITPNKVYLAPAEATSLYRKTMRDSQAYYHEKTSKLLGFEVEVFGTLDFTFSPKKRLIEFIKTTPIAPYAKALRAKLG
jgi:Methyltransferase domain